MITAVRVVRSGPPERHLGVHRAVGDGGDAAAQGIAGTGAHEESRHQGFDGDAIFGESGFRESGFEVGERACELAFESVKGFDHPQPFGGQAGAAAVATAGPGVDQRLAEQVVHGVDGVPRGPVGDPHRPRGAGDAAFAAQRLDQADAFPPNAGCVSAAEDDLCADHHSARLDHSLYSLTIHRVMRGTSTDSTWSGRQALYTKKYNDCRRW
ncbi:hypothetical protein [Azospirillum sp. TSO22-1]|uniref:hypothetical protein n=1 Tax=Azospirillum sp. TSO22-1 TaxID=716789 RepID=UPI001FFEA541|nr:hypothetical protein [Azospirillum sp. TSO22-1]